MHREKERERERERESRIVLYITKNYLLDHARLLGVNHGAANRRNPSDLRKASLAITLLCSACLYAVHNFCALSAHQPRTVSVAHQGTTARATDDARRVRDALSCVFFLMPLLYSITYITIASTSHLI